ncbi:N-acetyltransferase [Clostridiaceae bacterium NSJ-31]|uniref:N-acetyltransferase n=1 Tax=Ligaoa zhengdingensis TaxID=2763658 RepID=A0A926I3F1_9FIRM|nr:N-acetyltransferase [Ligaoa zhengdingensis]
MMIELRQEQPNDYFETENVIREAFWNHYTPACNDHYLIHIMRDCSVFVPELDIVAVNGQKIVGNSMCLKSYIAGDDGTRYEVLSLGPIGVLPEYQKMGVGGMMIARTREIAKKLGFRGILLCGDPDYYTRQGFVAAENYGIRNSENLYADALHACELYTGAFAKVQGRYYEDEIYNVDESLVKEYDKLFPAKDIVCGTMTQKKFEMMLQRVKPYKA